MNAFHGYTKNAVLQPAGLDSTLITFPAEAVLAISYALSI
jgi:hypothetical protein